MPRYNPGNERQTTWSTESWEQGGWGTVSSVAWLNVAWSLSLWEFLFRWLSPKSFRAACLSPVETFCFLCFSFSWFTAANLSNQGHLPGAFPTVNIWHCLGQRGPCLLRSQTQKLSPEYCKGGHLSLCSAITLVINPLICLSNHLLIHPIDFILQCTWSDDCVLNMGNAILSLIV